MHARYPLIFTLGLVLAAAASGPAAAQGPTTPALPYHLVTEDDLVWRIDPEFHQLDHTVVFGDPSSSGRYVYRLRANAPAALSLHSHEKSEYVTVLRGTLEHAPEGASRNAARSCGAGCFVVIPAGRGHQGWLAAGTVLQIHGVGPVEAHTHPADPPS